VSLRVGIDVGGTFTDFLVAEKGAEPKIYKVLSSPDRPADAVLEGIETIAKDHGLTSRELLQQVTLIVHGTTIATNAVLTGQGARTALLTTKGFRDILQMRQGLRERPYDNNYPAPDPLVPRRLRLEVDERVTTTGEVLQPPREADLIHLVDALPAEVEAVAVCLMHAYAASDHERRVAEIVQNARPDCYVSVSHKLLPTPRLYDRTSTTVLNAYVGPPISEYLSELQRRLGDGGFQGVLLIMQSNGGVSSPEIVADAPATTLLSGPAAGPRAGLAHAAEFGVEQCITVDMGGTSFDACLVKGGDPLLTKEGQVGRWRVALPMLDINTIGAGGGSLASVEGGMLTVGPKSAGARPGPACYGRGGDYPTVTDANLLLGYLDASVFFGGRITLSCALAERAVAQHVAVPLGLDTRAAAAGIYDLVCFNMAEGIREITIQRGFDPREFPLVVVGGAGPVHACAIARLLDVGLVVIPREASIFCAAGMLAADFRHDFIRSLRAPLDTVDESHVRALVDEMVESASATLDREQVAPDRRRYHASVEARYATQWYDLSIPLTRLPWDEGGRDAMTTAFHDRHETVFGYTSDEPILLTGARLSATGLTDTPRFPFLAKAESPPAPRGVREIYLGQGRGFGEASVYAASDLRPGVTVVGPSLIEQPTTTLVLLPGFSVSTGSRGDFIVRALQPTDVAEEVFIGAVE
jgi:N-methylhydantoinase A